MNLDFIDLEAAIIPEASSISVRATVIYSDPQRDTSVLLHPSLRFDAIRALKGSDLIEVDFIKIQTPKDFFIKGDYYSLSVPESLRSRDQLKLEFQYSGQIARGQLEASRIGTDYVELAIYALWYPISSFEDRPSFKVTLHGPDDWMWIMNAPLVSTKPLVWQSIGKAMDLTLHGRPEAAAITEESSDLFWGTARHFDRFRALENDFLKLKSIVRNWLGPADYENLKIVLTPRETGGGYSRAGLIVLQDDLSREYIDENRISILKHWTHELAHFWFRKAPISEYHNWIDEAMAEYIACLAVGEFFEEEELQKRIRKYQEVICREKDLPPINSILRQEPKADLVYYVYGSLILNEIKERIGRNQFLEFAKMLAQKERNLAIVRTNDLIHCLNEVTNIDWTKYIGDRISRIPDPLE